MAFTSGAKAQIFFMAGTAGINACSTPWGTGHGFDKGMKACSTPWNFQRLKPVMIEAETAGLKPCSTPASPRQGWNLVASTPAGVC